MKKAAAIDASVAQTLDKRSVTHGEFSDNADLAMQTRALWRTGPTWSISPPEVQLALDEIALKVARALSTRSRIGLREHLHDIAGYATKAMEKL